MERLNRINEEVNRVDEEEPERTDMPHRKRTAVVIAVIAAIMTALFCTAGWIINNRASGISIHSRDGDIPDQGLSEGAENALISNVDADENSNEEIEAEIKTESETPPDIDSLDKDIASEYAAPHKTTEIVKLTDLYAAPESEVYLYCFYPEAESYTWEVYDRHKCTWETVDSEILQDELDRPVSVIRVLSGETDTTPVRCDVHLGNGETVTESASVYSIPAEIQSISVKEEYVTDAGRYVSSREIPVCVSYADGTQNTITGLCGMTFVESTQNREISAGGTGNSVETITTVYTESTYVYIGLENKTVLLRYRCGDQTLESESTISGRDLSAPVISDVSVSGYEVTNVDAPVTAHVSITAKDDKTPYPDLEYAFIPKDKEKPDEEDWNNKPAFDLDITQNGIWTAFCRDSGGNIASMEKEIIVVDQKAPVISVRLLNTEWCSSNQIIVDAEDYLPVEFRFLSSDKEKADSGWITQNTYDVNHNGSWEVQVRDSVGNVSSENITISNIDKQSPVIKAIKVEASTSAETEPEIEKGIEGETQGGRNED